MIVKISALMLMAYIAASAGEDLGTIQIASYSSNKTERYYKLPQTKREAVKEGWTSFPTIAKDFGVQSALGYKGDPTVILLYTNNRISGVQIAFLRSDVENTGQPLRYASRPPVITKTINRASYYTLAALFPTNEITGERSLRFQEKDGYLNVPTNTTRVLSETSYLKKNCIPGMGIHYFGLDANSDCALIYPWLLLASPTRVLGFAFFGFGSFSKLGARPWWEYFTIPQLKAGVSDLPDCVGTAVTAYSDSFLHFWFAKNPEDINCSSWDNIKTA